MSEHFDRYMEGWTKGDVEMILSACADDFVFDDPIDGRFTKAEFPAYFESLREGVLEITDVVAEEIGGLETAWCWYSLKPQPGAALVSQAGAALAKVGRDGVHYQKVAYYAREPNLAPGRSSI
jgi:SnoaL-like domain